MMMQNKDFHALLKEMQNATSTLEERPSVSNKIKCSLAMWSCNHPTVFLSSLLKYACPDKKMHMNGIYS